VEFSDFLCPWCRALAAALKDFLPRSGDRVAIHFKNYPLDKSCNPRLQNTVHEGACWLALGGICAQDQGRFWPYHDRVFGTQMEKARREDAGRLAAEAGLDRRALEACIDSPGTRERLAAQVAEAERSSVQATPTVFLNGKRLPRVNDFLLAVDKESVRLGFAPLAAPSAR
jgi:protein-disulfide isomerase